MAQGQDTVVHAAHGGSDARFVADAVVEKLNRGNLDLLKSAGMSDTAVGPLQDASMPPAAVPDYGDLFGASDDPSGLKDFMNAADAGNPYSDDRLTDNLDPTKQADPRTGGSQLSNQVRDWLASKGISESYVHGLDGEAATNAVPAKDQWPTAPDVASFSPAFRDTVDPSRYKNSVDARPSRDAEPQSGEPDQSAGENGQPEGGFWSGVKAFASAVATAILHGAGRGLGAAGAIPAEIALHSNEDTYNGVKGLVQQGQLGTTNQAAGDYLRQLDKEEGRDPTRHLTADYKQTPGGSVTPADIQAVRKAGPVDPVDPMQNSGRTEAQTHRLAEGVAIGIMSKINPKPYEGSAGSGPIVIPGNPIADPLDASEKPGTRIKPRKPDGPVGL
jgi:hypothetical protein